MEQEKYEEIYSTIPFTPSKYQDAIFDFVANGEGNGLINACAGSAKTTTAIQSLRFIPPNKKVLFIAFNRDIVKEISAKTEGMKNVTVKTCHSLGYNILNRNFRTKKVETENFKYKSYIRNHILDITNIALSMFSKEEYSQYLDKIFYLVNMARLNLVSNLNEMTELAKKYNISLDYDEAEAALSVMDWGMENLDEVDYTDMVWLPNVLDLNTKGFQFDWIYVDECQDINNAQRGLFLKCRKEDTRILMFGDRNQAIYAFSGASPEAFDELGKIPNTKEFPLSISYRCASNIVKFAKTLVPEIESAPNAKKGEVVYNVKIKEIKDGDMVLCRNRQPLITLYMKFLKESVKSYIRGKDIGKNLINLIQDTNKEELNVSLQNDGVFVQLWKKLFEIRDKYMIKHGLTKEEATFTENVVAMYDSIIALEALSEGLEDSKSLIERLGEVFTDNGTGIELSTIHKSKGLEANNVYILCKSLMPSKQAKMKWEIKQEENLCYVAYTRAKLKLGFVSEKEISPSLAMSNADAMYGELSNIEKKIREILNITTEDVFTKKKIKKLKPVEEANIGVFKGREENSLEDLANILNKRKKKKRGA